MKSAVKAEKRKAPKVHLELAFEETRKLPTQLLGKLPAHPKKLRQIKSTLRIVEDLEEARPLKKKRVKDQVKPEAERPGAVMEGISPKESSVVEEIEAAPEVVAPAQDAIYKKAFTNILANVRKFLGMSPTIQEVLFEGECQPSRKATVSFEDNQALMVRALSSVPLPSVPIEVVHLSDFDRGPTLAYRSNLEGFRLQKDGGNTSNYGCS
ncbi:hypothetical protein FH972_027208 [Carpinus fangiana]|uniref:Uncharacterized protein n=1 Tax=Carpinus fangiana TaxID=176857 RepID=A0A5N6L6A7_9ROSI|nr:hypothetical protein FH972_027208 [Carpinus fangiana]